MDFLNTVFKDDPDYRKLSLAVKRGNLPAVCTGLSSVHKALLVSTLYKDKGVCTCVITEDESAATLLVNDLKALGVSAAVFPSRDRAAADGVTPSREYENMRINTLSGISDGAFQVVAMSVEAAVFPVIPKKILKENTLTIDIDSTVGLDELVNRLLYLGYERTDTVEGAGQFSVRGGIIDIFTTFGTEPYRIELWGDTVDTMSLFDTDTQRRTDNADKIIIPPAREVIYDRNALADILENELKKKLSAEQRKKVEDDIEALRDAIEIPQDRYLPLVYKDSTVFDYLTGFLFALSESGNIKERLKNIEKQENEDVKVLLKDGSVIPSCENFLLSDNAFYNLMENALILDNFPRGHYEVTPCELFSFSVRRSTAWGGDLNVLKEDIEYILSKNGSVVVLAGEERAAKVLTEQLNDCGINAFYTPKMKEVKCGVSVTVGGLSSGFELNSVSFMLVTVRGASYSGQKRRKLKKPSDSKSIGSLDELKIGDHVVHAAHGIGVFCGINNITNKGITKDYIKIRYAGGDILYVPVTQLDIVSKYIGADTESIKLHKLGGTEWNKTRKRVRKAVKDMAEELTALYAKRMAVKGYAFSPDTDLQNDFERRFPYEETEDQLRSVGEIKADMEKAVPMDRLLCGDVGFGKTEVALRAAFKCISEGKQCALLVPTTILASQHYNTAVSRFGELPVTVKMLSRFVTPAQQKRTLAGLRSGSVDMVIGTHRLISKDVCFKDLGLVIIDEEQRFGVAQKEHLKELFPAVDVLTLSATPIPRTLNMALSGLRDMSSIDEAPGDRHPVQTYVCEQDNGLLIDAVKRELRRGGQVYYLHNRVETIEKCAIRLKEQLPDARIAVAHGKMNEEELSDVWKKLVEQEIDVLVCTTIIETGVDVANVNTLIIEDANRMGLSQLHQLRGRVGRSSRRAYAYFCFKQGRVLSEEAFKRLEAIREFTEFGSGFKIAMRDLEIRGAGSILGGEQSGNMEAVGYDMYIKLLNEAMHGENISDEPEEECTVDINVSAHIPESYIPSLPARLGMYKRIADIRNAEEKSDVIDELCDRFGEPPRTVVALTDVALMRNRAKNAGVYEINEDGRCVLLKLKAFSPELFGKLGNLFENRVRLLSGTAPVISVRARDGQNTASLISEIADAL